MLAIDESRARLYQKDVLIQQKDALIHQKNVSIHQKDALIHQKDVLIHTLQNKVRTLELDIQINKEKRNEVQTQRKEQSLASDHGDVAFQSEEDVRDEIAVDEHGVQQGPSVGETSAEEAEGLQKRHEMTNSLAAAKNRYELATSMIQSWDDGAKVHEGKMDKRRRGKRTRHGTSN
jgi:hypothetical protein